MPLPELKGTLTDIGTEELNHLEMIGAIVYQLTKDLTEDEIKEQGFGDYFVDHTTGIFPQAEVFAEALVVDNLTGTQKANRIFYIVVIAESEDVIVGCSGFLLSRHTFVQIGYRVAFNLH